MPRSVDEIAGMVDQLAGDIKALKKTAIQEVSRIKDLPKNQIGTLDLDEVDLSIKIIARNFDEIINSLKKIKPQGNKAAIKGYSK